MENFEESESINMVSTRKGLKVYCDAPEELNSTNICEIKGHDFSGFNIPDGEYIDTNTWPNMRNLSLHTALAKDESEPATVGNNSEKHRGRFIAGEAELDHSWLELTTQRKIGLDEKYYLDNSPAVEIGGAGIEIPCSGHPYVIGQSVTISGTTNYDGTYSLVSVGANSFVISAAYVAETFAVTDYATSDSLDYVTQLGNTNGLLGS